ncbi:MAG: hypothetical protein ABJC89_09535 [Acidobacteriota bacterium]
MKTFLRVMTVGVSLLALSSVASANGVQAAAQVSAADAAPFLGEWTLAMQGPNGPASFTLSVSAEKEKVTAEIASDATVKQPISTISVVDKRLVLGYSFLYEGNPVDAVVSLTPDKDGKTTAAQIDFAGGAYVMTGAATKNEKGK